ncbi:FYVE zinc finger protein-like protein [Phyllosticta citriasiana]|uniref:RING-type E3 ubiquitin transferase n=1 Tax=Phyllosticta citriasiana TaxID=595635 RepID=A0ABR1KJR5_9PEZI
MDTSPATESAPPAIDSSNRSSSTEFFATGSGSSDTASQTHVSHGETETPRYRSAPSDASRGGETWMDFLRSDNDNESGEHLLPRNGPGNSEPYLQRSSAQAEGSTADTARLADRKRRLNVPEPSGRRGGYRSSSSHEGTEHATAGASASNAIDLTGSSPERPAQPSATSPSHDGEGRRESDIVIPTWQPDSAVSNCPVCGTQFSFWYRKHHCRKCGRVVCNNCSPHRITIPRQYIVRAPEEIKMQQGGNLIDLTGDSETDRPSAPPTYNPALGGGEEVRVCNPCVPDPNFSPPPQQDIQSRFPDFFSAGFSDSSAQAYTPLSPGGRSRNFTIDSQGFSRFAPAMSGHRPSLSDVSSRNAAIGSRSDDNSSRARGVGLGSHQQQFSSTPLGSAGSNGAGRSPYSYPHHPGSLSFLSQHMRSSRTHSAGSTSTAHQSRYRQFAAPTSSQQPSPAPRRRVVPEEDECPICHEELPPKGPDGSTAQREAHVEDCIAANFAGRPGPAQGTPGSGGGTPSAISGHGSPAGTPPVVAEGSRGRRRATHGMLRYRATEKDCIDEKGEPQECIICFEEFHEGDEMGRLECFCKFHRACIRSWWDTKGDGSCPTHQGSVTLG